jgi:hypothetical protein
MPNPSQHIALRIVYTGNIAQSHEHQTGTDHKSLTTRARSLQSQVYTGAFLRS